MATAPKNPFLFLIFLSIVIVLFWVVNSVVEVQLFPDDKIYYTPPPKNEKIAEEKEPVSNAAERDEGADDTPSESSAEVGDTEIDQFESSLRVYKAEILSQLAPGEKRMDVVVRYYPHAPDGDAVYKLRDLGYYLHERPTDPAVRAEPSNALFYGDNVPLKDIQLVAITLLDAGIPLKLITESRFHADWKANALEIGSDGDLEDTPILTKAAIRSFVK